MCGRNRVSHLLYSSFASLAGMGLGQELRKLGDSQSEIFCCEWRSESGEGHWGRAERQEGQPVRKAVGKDWALL